jgi:hypothetical protein
MASQTTDRFKPVALAYSAPSHQHQTDLRTRRSYAISFEKPDPANPPSRLTGEFIGCDLAWDESGKPLVSATVNDAPVHPATLRVFKERGRISTVFALDLPGGPIAPKIEVVIETTPLPYGQRCETTPSLVLTLDSVHIVCEFDPPPVFYNAFPDLNGVAEDDSYSAAPTGAKYMLPLDCIFNPYAIPEELHAADPLRMLPGYRRLRQDYDATDKIFVAMPREPELERDFILCAGFEETHARLAATWYKLMFRADVLGPFYNTLWDWISKKRIIKVPLVTNPDGSELQRQWHRIRSWFLETCLLDEACSLLATVALISNKQERARDERRWVQAEDHHMQGKFAPVYRILRSAAEHLYGSSLDACRKDNEGRTFAEVAITLCSTLYDWMVTTGRSDLEYFLNGNNAWAKTPPSERKQAEQKQINAFIDRLPNLCERLGEVQVKLVFLLMFTEARSSFTVDPSFGPDARTELIQAFRDRGERHDLFTQFFYSQSATTSKGISYISVTPTGQLINLLASSESVPLDGRQFKEFPSDQKAMYLKAMYTIFLEPIRQQICQGVGLRCPFWNGECCQRRDSHKRFKKLLEQTYKITRPYLWPEHWQKPPCLGE